MNEALTQTKNVQKDTNRKVFSSPHYANIYSLYIVSIQILSSKLQCDLTAFQLEMTKLSLNGFRKAEIVSSH